MGLGMDVQKLAKVLALAASDNDTEAVQALRTARRLLDGHGVDFVELARRVAEAEPGVQAERDALEDLRNEIRHLRSENERLRQGRGMPVAAPEPASLQESARDFAESVRLRADLAQTSVALEMERAEVQRLKAQEATWRSSFQEALAEAGKLGARLSDAESRRMRLEAENRRLLHANYALSVELAEAKAARPPVPAPRPEAEPRTRPAPRAKAKARASQYALF
jgi:chromosome segregation ATPase